MPHSKQIYTFNGGGSNGWGEDQDHTYVIVVLLSKLLDDSYCLYGGHSRLATKPQIEQCQSSPCDRDHVINKFKGAGLVGAGMVVTLAAQHRRKLMDNANLEKIKVIPGRLVPKFKASVTNYSVVVGSTIPVLKLTILTSDSGASYTIEVSMQHQTPIT